MKPASAKRSLETNRSSIPYCFSVHGGESRYDLVTTPQEHSTCVCVCVWCTSGLFPNYFVKFHDISMEWLTGKIYFGMRIVIYIRFTFLYYIRMRSCHYACTWHSTVQTDMFIVFPEVYAITEPSEDEDSWSQFFFESIMKSSLIAFQRGAASSGVAFSSSIVFDLALLLIMSKKPCLVNFFTLLSFSKAEWPFVVDSVSGLFGVEK